MKVLLIEDNVAMQVSLQRSLERRGMHIVVCGDGHRALERWRASAPDVVLLDLSLPGKDGLAVLGEARAEGLAAPVIVLTARGTVGDRVLGLNTGADDYLPKPFDLDELEARIKALSRRSGAPSASAPAADFHGLSVDEASGAVHWRERPMNLTPREVAMLRALLAKPGHAVTKEHLNTVVFWDEPDVQMSAIEVVAYRLRKKLAGTGVDLVTLRGLGYLVQVGPDA
jgi:two-component system, OmpR family, response regulator TctD